MNVCASIDDQKASSRFVVQFHKSFKSPLHDALYFYYLALMNMEAGKIAAAAAFAERAILSCLSCNRLDDVFLAKLRTLI